MHIYFFTIFLHDHSLSVTCGRSVVLSKYFSVLYLSNWPPQYNWNVVDSGIKHYNPNPPPPTWLYKLIPIPIYYDNTSVDTEMCCPKSKCGCQYFILLTLNKKKIMDTGVLDFFNKKLILDYYFCLKSGPVFLFQIFIIAPLPLPRDKQLYH